MTVSELYDQLGGLLEEQPSAGSRKVMVFASIGGRNGSAEVDSIDVYDDEVVWMDF